MHTDRLSPSLLDDFKFHLTIEEKSAATIEKYMRDTKVFFYFSGDEKITKETVINFKEYLIDKDYKPNSINSMLASVNKLLSFMGLSHLRAKAIKSQRAAYCSLDKELTKGEYKRLLSAAGCGSRIYMIMQTIASTGIRISELQYFTAQSVKRGEININLKGKRRTILIPTKLKSLLISYMKKTGIKDGCIFVTKGGKPINRSNIWKKMKELCRKAGVCESKVFPHNLRKLFAKTFYELEKDIAKLADILGHSSIDTTRIYIISSGREHRRLLDRMQLII